MCEKQRMGNALTAPRTLRAGAARCAINEKHKQKQPTDRAAPCGLLSGPLSVGSCAPPLIALPSFRKCTAPRLPAKSRRSASMQPVEMPQTVTPWGKARADGETAADKRPALCTIIAAAPMRKPRRTARPIAVRWRKGHARRRRPVCRSVAAWTPGDWRVQRLPTA